MSMVDNAGARILLIDDEAQIRRFLWPRSNFTFRRFQDSSICFDNHPVRVWFEEDLGAIYRHVLDRCKAARDSSYTSNDLAVANEEFAALRLNSVFFHVAHRFLASPQFDQFVKVVLRVR